MTGKNQTLHPAAYDAMKWLKEWLVRHPEDYHMIVESFALSGNELAEMCLETLRRLLTGENVSDRHLLGLCWTLRDMECK